MKTRVDEEREAGNDAAEAADAILNDCFIRLINEMSDALNEAT
jgi:hypothetical protein